MWWQMFSGHNCTNYVAYRLVRSGMSAARPWSGSGNADNWGRAKRGITDGKPMVGAVAWWRRNVPGAGSSGHVAYVEKVLSPTKIVISEDSWSGDFHWRRISKSGSGWPTGFIHFKDRKVAVQSRPDVTGRPAVGQRLVASAGRWSVSSKHTFQWLADGKRIRGATSARFTPGPGLQGRRLSVRVTASRRGYRDRRHHLRADRAGWRAGTWRPWPRRRSRAPCGSARCCRCAAPPGRRARTRRPIRWYAGQRADRR